MHTYRDVEHEDIIVVVVLHHEIEDAPTLLELVVLVIQDRDLLPGLALDNERHPSHFLALWVAPLMHRMKKRLNSAKRVDVRGAFMLEI